MDIQAEFECYQNVFLHLKDLLLRVRVVSDEYEVFELGDVNLFILGRQEQSCYRNELEPCAHDLRFFEIAVDYVYCKKQRLWLQLKAQVHLDDPINKDATHLLINVHLHAHVAL